MNWLSAEDMPEDYLHKILQSLRKATWSWLPRVKVAGIPSLGIQLDISVWDIVTALDGGFKISLRPNSPAPPPIPKLTHCQTNQIWKALEQSIETTLTDMTLAEL
jgi:DNA-binding IscR family transcriptional regulator